MEPFGAGVLWLFDAKALDAPVQNKGNRFKTRENVMFGNCLRISVLAIACGAAIPAFAVTPYDGRWSVVISTEAGACDSSARFALQIENGRVIASNNDATVQGQVTPGGNVKVLVQSGGSWADGSGRLTRTGGSGLWRGQGQRGPCQGTWVAERAGNPEEAAGVNGPIYNYVPQQTAPSEGIAEQAAACAARFHTYNAATGTYLGVDGRPHRCP